MIYVRALRNLVAGLIVGGVLFVQSGNARSNTFTVDFANQGSFQTAVWQTGSLAVTASDTLNFLQYNGIGVVGQTDHAIDPGESVIFSFSAPATFVKLFNGALGNLDGIKFHTAVIQAFGVDGALLGAATGIEPTPWVIVSELFGEAPIMSFSVRATEDLYRFSALEFTLAVPEPQATSMLAGGLFVLLLALLRRQR